MKMIKHLFRSFSVSLSSRWNNCITDQSLVGSDSRRREMRVTPHWIGTTQRIPVYAGWGNIFCFHLSNLWRDRNLPGRLKWAGSLQNPFWILTLCEILSQRSQNAVCSAPTIHLSHIWTKRVISFWYWIFCPEAAGFTRMRCVLRHFNV